MSTKNDCDNTLKSYDAGDMLDAYSLAYEQMADTSIMLNAVSNEFKNGGFKRQVQQYKNQP